MRPRQPAPRWLPQNARPTTPPQTVTRLAARHDALPGELAAAEVAIQEARDQVAQLAALRQRRERAACAARCDPCAGRCRAEAGRRGRAARARVRRLRACGRALPRPRRSPVGEHGGRTRRGAGRRPALRSVRFDRTSCARPSCCRRGKRRRGRRRRARPGSRRPRRASEPRRHWASSTSSAQLSAPRSTARPRSTSSLRWPSSMQQIAPREPRLPEAARAGIRQS